MEKKISEDEYEQDVDKQLEGLNLAEKIKHARPGEEIGRVKWKMGKGKRAVKVDVVLRICDDPVPMEEMYAELAKVLAPAIEKRMNEILEEKANVTVASPKRK